MQYYDASDKHRWSFKIPIVLGIGALLMLAGYGGYKTFHQKVNHLQTAPVTQPEEPKILPSSVTGKYLFNGTTVWARAVEKYAYGDFSQPFSQLDTFDRQSYDAWSTDFECPITNNTVPYATQISNLVFNCRPEFLPAASKYFNLFDLANNHTDNQGGQTGLAETRQHLAAVPGMQFYGNFDPTITKDICEVIALPVRVQKVGSNDDKAQLPVAFCAWHYFNYFRGPTTEELAVVAQYANVMPVFGFAEMGLEYQASASESVQQIAHQMVDTGLDFLLANNPHWVQNAESYKGKLIVYSMGNFIFDQLDTETQRSASIDTTLKIKYDDNVAKWLVLGPTCAVFQDNCLQAAVQQGLHKVSLSLNYKIVAGQGGANKVTHKADAVTQGNIETRLNWAQVSTELEAKQQ